MQGESLSGGRRIGLLGGTFDPPHIGHLFAARAAAHAHELDEVRFLVAGDPWQKTTDGTVTEARHRLAMMRLAVDGAADLQVSAIEVDRAGPTYTADTVTSLDRAEPGVDWFFIMGTDTAAGLDTWERPETVRDLVILLILARPPRIEVDVPDGWSYELVDVPLIDLSSTELRSRLARGEPVEWLVPTAVIDYAHANSLYGVER